MNNIELATKLVLSIVFGGIIGVERENAKRPAGFRTHILVCMGSSLTMIISLNMFDLFYGKVNIDPGRIAAQVISGIGFLGAGTIIQDKGNVRGLTTAASLWTVAAIGLAVGSGFYIAAALTTFLTFVTLVMFSKLESYMPKKNNVENISLLIANEPDIINQIETILNGLNIKIKHIKVENRENNKLFLMLSLFIPPRVRANEVAEKLLTSGVVFSLEYENFSYTKKYFLNIDSMKGKYKCR